MLISRKFPTKTPLAPDSVNGQQLVSYFKDFSDVLCKLFGDYDHSSGTKNPSVNGDTANGHSVNGHLVNGCGTSVPPADANDPAEDLPTVIDISDGSGPSPACSPTYLLLTPKIPPPFKRLDSLVEPLSYAQTSMPRFTSAMTKLPSPEKTFSQPTKTIPIPRPNPFNPSIKADSPAMSTWSRQSLTPVVEANGTG